MLALLVPALLIVDLIKSQSWRHRRWIITLFFTLFGSLILLGTSDGYRHQLAVDTYYASMSLGQFLRELWEILTFQINDSPSKDVYKHVISYVFGGVLGTPRLFFPFVAFVYGYFFSGAVLHVLTNFRLSQTNYVILAVVFVFLFLKGLEGVQTVRTWTGLWVLVYACLKYYETRRYRYLLLMFAPPFIHIGYFLMAIPAWVVLVFGNRGLLYASIFAASTVANFIPADPALDLIAQTERGAYQVRAYRVDEQTAALEEFQAQSAQTNWYNAYRRAGLQRWAPTVLVFSLLLSGVYFRGMTAYQRRILSIGIVTLAFSNLTWFLFAVHNRSLTVATVFILAAYLMARLDPQTKELFVGLPAYYKLGLHLSLALFFPLMLFQVSVVLDQVSLFLLAFPFLVWMSPEANMSLKAGLNILLGRG